MVRVLVVDDDVMVGVSLSMASDAFEIVDAARVATALALVRDEHFDAIVCGRRLPDGDGLTFVRLIRTEAATAHVPVVVVSAGHDEAQRREVLEAGAQEALGKPIDGDALAAAVLGLIEPVGTVAPRATTRSAKRYRSERPAPPLPLPAPRSAEQDPLQVTSARLAAAVVEQTRLEQQLAGVTAERDQLAVTAGALRAELEESRAAHAALQAEVFGLRAAAAERVAAGATLDLRTTADLDRSRTLMGRVVERAKHALQ